MVDRSDSRRFPGAGHCGADPGDVEQVRSVRGHLRAVAQFEHGDCSAPERIDGKSMPKLKALRNPPPGAVAVRYADVPGGGLLIYSSRDHKLISALHRWFDAQLSDHGADARARHVHSDGSDHSVSTRKACK